MRIGQGFDAHRFSTGSERRLILGGVEIPGSPGLEGHSDADALTHALADAVLGAAALGDLGALFPASDPRWAGADSTGMLAEAVRLARAAGLAPVNADCTVVAEAPRLAPHTDRMSARLGDLLGAPVSVRAKRTEGLGALGRSEGVACLAVVLLGEVEDGSR